MPQQEGSEFLEGPIDPPKTVEEIKKDPIALPAGFEWSVIDVKNEEQVDYSFDMFNLPDARGAYPLDGELCRGR